MQSDRTPAVAIGHVVLYVSDTARAAEFYLTLGLRPIWNSPEMAILELRGGTHLMLFRSADGSTPGPVAAFDFMVDDLHASRDSVIKAGLNASEIITDAPGGHHMFEVTDPDGHVLKMFSSHTEGRPV